MEELKFCGNCGAKLVENTEFCGNCGNRIQKDTDYAGDTDATVGVFGGQNDSQTNKDASDWRPPVSNTINDFTKREVSKPKKKHTGLIVGIVVAVLLVLAFIGNTAEKVLQNQGYGESHTTSISTEKDIDVVDDGNKEYVRGTFTTTTYESEFIGVRYTAPENWAIASESELAQMPSDPRTTWEMHSISSLDGSNVIVAVEELPTENMTVSMYINSLKSTLQSNTDITATNISEDGTKLIAGEEYAILSYSAAQNGFTYKQSFYLRKINKHMVAFTVTSVNTSTDEILSNFVKY